MMRNEALEMVERLETVLETPRYTPANGNGKALNIARQLVTLLSEEDLPVVTPVKMKPQLDRMKKMADTGTYHTEDRNAFIRKLGRASCVYKELGTALEWLAAECEKNMNITVRFKKETERIPVDKRIGYLLFRSTGELLKNVAQHAGSGKAVVTAGTDGRNVTVVVEDRGKGFDAGDEEALIQYARGTGIGRIRKEITYAGGHLDVESVTTVGTRVTMVTPVEITR